MMSTLRGCVIDTNDNAVTWILYQKSVTIVEGKTKYCGHHLWKPPYTKGKSKYRHCHLGIVGNYGDYIAEALASYNILTFLTE